MDSKCCAGDEAKASQQNDAVDAQPAMNSEGGAAAGRWAGITAKIMRRQQERHQASILTANIDDRLQEEFWAKPQREAPMYEDVVKRSPAVGTEEKSEKLKPSLRKKKEFTIKLNKGERGLHLGLSVHHPMDGTYIHIDAVHEGLVDAWNQEHPGMKVKANDHVMAVNGIRGNAHHMAEACKNSDKLEMLIATTAHKWR